MKAIAILVPAAAVLLLLAGLVQALWPTLRRQITYPGGRLSPAEGDPARWGLPDGEQVWLEAEDGIRIHGWWVPASRESCGAVIYFHGNGDTIAPRAWLARRLSELGLDVLLFDYRGYGLSEGRPSERGLRLDARAAWDHVVEERGTPPEGLLLFGHSLGSAVATELALHRPAAALALGAPFPAFPDLVRHHASWLPVGLLPWNDGRYDAGARIGDVAIPVLIALGKGDRVIPPRFSRAVYHAAPEPRRLVETAAEHNTLIGQPEVWRALTDLLRDRLGCAG